MAKKIYVGVSNKARKVTKAYVGVNGVARRIKKAYIGIGGVARPVLASDGIVYYGTITNLSTGRSNLAATTIGNYAIFAGGQTAYYSVSNTVDAYNSSLTISKPTSLYMAKQSLAAASIGDYALFAGGYRFLGDDEEDYWPTDYVDAYNKSLTRSSPGYLDDGAADLAATTVGNYAIFAGGARWYSYDDTIYYPESSTAFDKSLTKSTLQTISWNRLAATTIGNYALFAGGGYYDEEYCSEGEFHYVSGVVAYDSSLTRSLPAALSTRRQKAAGVSVGNYALFAGGDEEYSYSGVVDVYDKSLTRSNATNLSNRRAWIAATAVGNYAILAGGYGGSSTTKVVEAYDSSLTRSILTELSQVKQELAATTIGDFALFAGGYNFDDYLKTVDVYKYNKN